MGTKYFEELFQRLRAIINLHFLFLALLLSNICLVGVLRIGIMGSRMLVQVGARLYLLSLRKFTFFSKCFLAGYKNARGWFLEFSSTFLLF